jgi:hypothetical protein
MAAVDGRLVARTARETQILRFLTFDHSQSDAERIEVAAVYQQCRRHRRRAEKRLVRPVGPETLSLISRYMMGDEMTPEESDCARAVDRDFLVKQVHTRAAVIGRAWGRVQSTTQRVRGVPVTRAPRRSAHGGRPAARRVARSARGPDDGSDGPGESPPPRAAQTRGGTYSYGCERCEACGNVLIWHGGQLKCCHRPCPFWGRAV